MVISEFFYHPIYSSLRTNHRLFIEKEKRWDFITLLKFFEKQAESCQEAQPENNANP
jgi:hypothetical protein